MTKPLNRAFCFAEIAVTTIVAHANSTPTRRE
jgi:hypothetical protein